MLDLSDGCEYWSIYVSSEGRKSRHDNRKLVEPWKGKIVSEMRSGRFVVLVRDAPQDGDLSGCYYVVIPHKNSASYLLFGTFLEALGEWEKQMKGDALEAISVGQSVLENLAKDRQTLEANYLRNGGAS